ncbi:MAG TPA: sigma-70 family RNA polymerase sigma factor [Thermoanaerobaculia bacterium]
MSSAPAPGDVTRLLQLWSGGDRDALERLIPLVYGELRRLAGRYMKRERPNHTLEPTAVVHEAFLRLIEQKNVSWKNRAHFFGVAAQAMRRVLVDHARRHKADKRGGVGTCALTLAEPASPAGTQPVDLIALDLALSQLAAFDEEKARVVELRYFGGLTVEETAEVIGASPSTVRRDWKAARVWLHRELSAEAP